MTVTVPAWVLWVLIGLAGAGVVALQVATYRATRFLRKSAEAQARALSWILYRMPDVDPTDVSRGPLRPLEEMHGVMDPEDLEDDGQDDPESPVYRIDDEALAQLAELRAGEQNGIDMAAEAERIFRRT